jgi:hypothetical protein
VRLRDEEGRKPLALADTEYLGAAIGASSLGSRSLVLEGDRLGILHFNFLSAFHAISLHRAPPILSLPSRVANLQLFVNSRRHKNSHNFVKFDKECRQRGISDRSGVKKRRMALTRLY